MEHVKPIIKRVMDNLGQNDIEKIYKEMAPDIEKGLSPKQFPIYFWKMWKVIKDYNENN